MNRILVARNRLSKKVAAANRRGGTLIFTLWLMVALAAAALYFGQSVTQHYRRQANGMAQIERRQAVDAAERYVSALLAAQETAGELPDIETYTAEELMVGDVRVFFLARPSATDADEPEFGLQSESGRINLNTAPPEMLEALAEMTPELAAAIVDWRDADDELSAYGAESETYLALDTPYTAKNADFETVDELRLLNAADAVLLTGRDRNRNGVVEDWEDELAEAELARFQGAPDFGLLDLATTLSREPNVRTDGSPRADLNGPLPAVQAALQEALGERGTTAVVTAGVGTRQFTSVLEFMILAGLSSEDAATAWPYVRIGNDAETRGLVNINTAPEAVLAAIPGVGEANAKTLVAHREQHAEELDSPYWLNQALGRDAALAAGPYITTQTYQISADIVAVSPGARGFTRMRVVYDLAAGEPVIVERRDLTHLGWPLGEDRLTTMRDTTRELSR